VSETRAAAAEQPCDLFAHTPRATKPVGQEASPADASSLGSSDLAKRFLGSLTPQLEPLSSRQESTAAPQNRSPSPRKTTTTTTTTTTSAADVNNKAKTPVIPDVVKASAEKKELPTGGDYLLDLTFLNFTFVKKIWVFIFAEIS
jgi:hypothetical protein